MHRSKTRRTHRLGSVSSGQPAGSNERLALEPLEERRMLAGTPELLADLSGQQYHPGKIESAEAGGLFYFSSGRNAGELWRSDGTAEGTLHIKTAEGFSTGYPLAPEDLQRLNGKLFFTAYDGSSKRKMWTTDGTIEGTHAIENSGVPESLGGFDSMTMGTSSVLLFTGYGTGSRHELWRSDGTASGTVKVKQLTQSYWDIVGDFQVVGDTAYFPVSVNGRVSLWQTDGTAGGTSETPIAVSNAKGPVRVWDNNGLRYFFINGASTSYVWQSDGTAKGSKVVGALPLSNWLDSPFQAEVFDGDLYFVAKTNTHGSELFKFDVETSAFSMVADLNPGAVGSLPRNFTIVGDALYFTALTGPDIEMVWRIDGGEVGAHPVGNLPSGALYGASHLANLGGELVFAALDPFYGLFHPELWKTDGTNAGTSLIKDLNPGELGLQFGPYGVANGKLFFVDYTAPDGFSLRVSDGTADGTQLVRVVSPSSLIDASVNEYLRVGQTTYIATEAGLWAVPDNGIAVRLSTHRSLRLVEVNGRVSFIMMAESSLTYVMFTDGTLEGTVSVHARISKNRLPIRTTEFNGLLYFTEGHDLWRTDGTGEGTSLVRSIWSDRLAGFSGITNVNGTLFFTAGGGSATRNDQLWVSDGTFAGTNRLDVPGLVLPGLFQPVGDLLYFNTYEQIHGEELWVSDGTIAGTRMVKDIQPGFAHGDPRWKANVNGRLYFVADDENGGALWTSDGTEAGTQIFVADEAPDSEIAHFFVVGDTLYFTREAKNYRSLGLWAITPGELEPRLVIDYENMGISVYDLAEVNGVLYFTVENEGGAVLWQSDGTAAGTGPVPDWLLEPNVHIDRLANVGGSLVFIANGPTGRDPWIWRPPAQVLGRHLLYNDSAFDGDSAAANAADDGAIAPDRIAYLPGSGRSTTANVSSYVHGINGVMIDIAGLEGELTADDFVFRVGTNVSSPENWAFAPAPLEVVVRIGAGANGSDRVTITWANGAIKNTWLQVTVQGNDAAGGFNTNTGLAESDVFFFGSRVGDTFEGAAAFSTATTSRDELAARFGVAANQSLTSLLDFNRDGCVSAIDQLIARQNVGVLRMLEIEEIAESLVTRRTTTSADSSEAWAPLERSDLAFALALWGQDFGSDESADGLWRGRRG